MQEEKSDKGKRSFESARQNETVSGEENNSQSPIPSAKLKEDADQAIKQLQDQMLRMRAEFENAKKRLERDRLEAVKFANEKLLAEILPIVDYLDSAMSSISEGHDPERVHQGLRIAQEELHKVLERHGVDIVESVGKAFDPKFHEAVGTVEASDKLKDGFVADEVQRGYLLNGRLVRPSRVRVAQKKE